MKHLLVAVLAVCAVGCGNGFRSGGSFSDNAAERAQQVDDTLDKVQTATVDAQKAMDEANAAIASISDSNGNIKINLFASNGSTVQSQGLLAPIIAKLKPVFDKVFEKVSFVKAQFDNAKNMLNAALAKLNPNDPSVIKLKEALAKVESLEEAFRTQVHMVAGKLTLALSGLDRLVSLATSFIPIPGLGMIAGTLIDMFVLDDVRNLVLDLQMKLLAI